jgi:hypothetical protein
MAESGRRKEREVVAGFEVALARCVYYCIHHFYPLHHISAFGREYQRDWSLNTFAVWAGGPDDDFVLFGTLDAAVPERRLTKSRRPPSVSRVVELSRNIDERTFGTCRTHLLTCLDQNGFRTPLSAPVLTSEMTVYQEVGYGTCWLAATLNLILHIPETRVVLWNALNRKRPTMDDTTIEFFVRTPLGRQIFQRYAQLHRRRGASAPDVLEGKGGTSGGYPKDLVRAMQDSIPGLNILVQIKTEQANLYKSHKWLVHLATHPDEDKARTFFASFEADMRKYNVMGAIVTGMRSNKQSGHAVAVCYDATRRANNVRVHNHGVSGREHTLLQFVTMYPVDVHMVMYTLHGARRHLFFDTAPAFV